MAEINNSLAAQIQSQPLDISKPLLAAGQIRALQTKSALEEAQTGQVQQETGYRQFQQDQNAGYRVPDVNTLAEAHQKQLGVAGQIGNMLVGDQSLASRKQAIQAAKDSGVKIDPQVEQHILTAPASQVKQYGQNMQKAGQASTSNIEQDPNKIRPRAAAQSGGAIEGEINPAPTQQRVDNAIKTGRNFDGSPRVLSTADIVSSDGTSPLEQKKIIEARGTERSGTALKNVEEFSGYKQSAANSSTTKTVLRSLQDDAERVYTGKGATNKGDAQKWILAASNIPGVGPLVKHFAGDQSDPVAAIENIRKNIGIISRQAVGDIHETSAAALESVQNSLPTEEMSSKGLKLATSQMMAIEDFKQARLQAAQKWKDQHNGTLDGFASDWSKNMGPATFVMARLPKEEQVAVRQRLGATPEGKRTLEAIDKQLQWGHKNGLDSVID